MSIPSGAVKIVLSGNLPGGDRWSTSFWVNPLNAAMDAVELTNLISSMDTDLAAGGGFYAALASINPAEVTLDTVTGYQYQGTSKAAVQAEIPANGLPTHTNAVKLPNQVAAVLSLRTGLPGRARRGRMYIPVLAAAMLTGGKVDTTLVNGLSNGLATSWGTFNSSGNGKVCVCSQSLSQLIQITDVIVDNVLDTQRRRRDKVVPTAHSSAVAA